MVEKEKIRVVWLCHFSNSFVRGKLELNPSFIVALIKRLVHKPVFDDVPEFANWITNGIRECEKIKELELHVVSPYHNLKGDVQEFKANGVHYHFFHNEDDDIISFLARHIFHQVNCGYKRNCRRIEKIINSIHPQIIHLFGAENPHYSLGFLGNYEKVVNIAQLQTLLNDPDFCKNYPIDNKTYIYRANIEKRILLKADYLGTMAIKFRHIIQTDINPHAIILNTSLALKDSIFTENCDKQYDFVYFSANLDKAADLALEAFGLAYQKNPTITMDVIGSCDDVAFQSVVNTIIDNYGIRHAVIFEGMLPTHDDVLKQIRKSRFALLPLKIDLTSGTIKEAMSNGLPVITTDTGEMGTQRLNLKRQNVLLSRKGDHQALAENMLRLLNDIDLAETLRQNAFQTRIEAKSNEEIVNEYVIAYNACLDHFWNNKPLPIELIK